jgi:serine/threonine protein kinase
LSEVFPVQPAVFGPGSVVAGYRLEAQVGAGGMAMVFRARDERLGRLVALKILAPTLTADSAFRRRFIAESRAAAAVDDPHIIPVHDAGEADGALFIAMRFVQGGDLRQVLAREGPLPPDRAAEFISPVASALDAAHRAGLVHRDVKPANILVDASADRPDHVYLSDFGVSKGATASVSLTGTGQFLGTPHYSAPEQVQGRAVDGRTDQYALACVAYQLLTGEAPFERDHGMAVLLAHLSEPPPSLCSRRPDLPAAADRVLARALAKAPQQRYASCRDFADALREALALVPYHSRRSAATPDHPQTVNSSTPESPAAAAAAGAGSLAAADLPSAPAIHTSPALPAAYEAVPSMSSGVAEEDVPAAAVMATATSLLTGELGTASESGRLTGKASPPAAGAGGPDSVTDIRTNDQRSPSIPGSGGKAHPAWRPQRLHVITLAGAVTVTAAIVASVLASSPGSSPTLTYSQFVRDLSAHEVTTVDLAYEVDGTSSGTLANGTSYTVVIPPQAGQFLLTDLVANGVQVTAASSPGSPPTLTYSQFLADVVADRVTTIDLAPSAGGRSSGRLTNGTSYTVVIPPQAGQFLMTFLFENVVQVTGSLPSSTLPLA